MNHIEKLIKELCPNGVEFKKLEDVISKVEGANKKLPKSSIETTGTFPVYTQGANLNPDGYTERANLVINNVPVILYGDHTNAVKWINTPFVIGADGVKLIQSYNEIILDNRFFYFCILNKVNSIPNGYARHYKLLRELEIPIPPLEVQREIVRILDNFTALEAELEAELEARRKQYEFYRDQLLYADEHGVMNSGVQAKWTTLGDFSECFAGATPKTSNYEYWNNGDIPWMSSGEVNKGKIYFTDKKITHLGFEKSSTKMIPENSVVVALAGQGKTRGTVALTKIPLCTNQSLCSIITNEYVDSSYLFFFLKTQYLNLRAVSSGEGTRGGLNLSMIKSYKVPVPPLAEQQRIVAILDKFDALVNDISEGLPAEIAARRKQYEFYRDKLLTFTPKVEVKEVADV